MMMPTDPVTQHELDRLVDGELSPLEYRRLLDRVEETPDGWKQCALAFLESQALREELPSATRSGVEAPGATVHRSAFRTVLSNRVVQLFAQAACVYVAISMTFVAFSGSERRPARPTPPPTNIATNTAPPHAIPQPAAERPQLVYVNQWDGQTGTEMPIPIDLTKTFDPREPWSSEWGLSAYELQRLQDAGHRLETQNHLIPVSLSSGQNVVVPMQEVILRRPPEIPFH